MATSSSPPAHESNEDRFQHEIEELEGQPARGRVILGLIVVALVAGAGFWFAKTARPRFADGATRASASLMLLELLEPTATTLAGAPQRLRWESVSGRHHYWVQVKAEGLTTPIIERKVRENVAALTPAEAARFVDGGRYTWRVEARNGADVALAAGERTFQLD